MHRPPKSPFLVNASVPQEIVLHKPLLEFGIGATQFQRRLSCGLSFGDGQLPGAVP